MAREPRNSLPEPLRILVAEDDPEMLDLLLRVLGDEGYSVRPARDGGQALALLQTGDFDIVVSDMRMPICGGMDVLRRAMASHLHQPVILMTAFGSIEAAVQAMREGAFHYLAKPFDIDELLGIVGEAAAQIRQSRAMAAEDAERSPFFPIVFRSRAMAELLRLARDLAASNATVLIAGDSGTGKELLARAIHESSPRRGRRFVALDCGAIPESLIESEVFGHARGAFTGAHSDRRGIVEEADGGTLFLDEVGNLSQPMQAKLLRFLQERRFRRVGEAEERGVDVRVLSATNQDLRALAGQGGFREDLYYRLAVIPLRVPPLRERCEDVPPLAYHFLRKYGEGYHIEGIRQDALEVLVGHAWPGNVRQLENVMERAVILRKAGLIQPRDLPEDVRGAEDAAATPAPSLEELEREHILRLLERHGGNQSEVARVLGINRRTVYRKLRKYGTDTDDRST